MVETTSAAATVTMHVVWLRAYDASPGFHACTVCVDGRCDHACKLRMATGIVLVRNTILRLREYRLASPMPNFGWSAALLQSHGAAGCGGG